MPTVTLHESRTIQVPLEQAFDRVLVHPLPEIFRRRQLAIPPINEVRGQAGQWGTVGETRTIVTSDGGTMLETLTSNERPSSFGYTISQVHGPMKPLVAGVEGRWSFESAGGGTQITWTWVLTPTLVGRVAMPVFAVMWRGYARKALEQVERILLTD